MNVRGWLEGRTPAAPAALVARALDALGADADAPAEQTPQACLDAARRVVDDLITRERYARDSAIDLLAADALVTWAYEYASTGSRAEVQSLVMDGARMLGQLATQHV